MFKSRLTSIFGLLAGIPQLLEQVGLALPPKWGGIISTIGVVGIGLAAKDWNAHGGTKIVGPTG